MWIYEQMKKLLMVRKPCSLYEEILGSFLLPLAVLGPSTVLLLSTQHSEKISLKV